MDQKRKGERWHRTWIDDEGETRIQVMAQGFCPGCSLGCTCGKRGENPVVQELEEACRFMKSKLKKLSKLGDITSVSTQSKNKKANGTLATVMEDADYWSDSDNDEISVVWQRLDKDLGVKSTSRKKQQIRTEMQPKFTCKYCNKKYKMLHHYKKHLETKHLEQTTMSNMFQVTRMKQGQVTPRSLLRTSRDFNSTSTSGQSQAKTSVDSGHSSGSSRNLTPEAGSGFNESLSMDLTACGEDLSAFLRTEDLPNGIEPLESGMTSTLAVAQDDKDNNTSLDVEKFEVQKSAQARPVARMSMSAFMSFRASPVHVLEHQDLLSFLDSPASGRAVPPGIRKAGTAANDESVSYLEESLAMDDKKEIHKHSSTMLSNVEASFEDLDLSNVENSFSENLDQTVRRNIRFSSVPSKEAGDESDDEELRDDPTVLYLRRKSVLDTHPYECKVPGCGGRFETSQAISNHIELHKNDGKYHCPRCKRSFDDRQKLLKHSELSVVSGCYDTDLAGSDSD